MSFSRNIGYRAAAEVLAKGGSVLLTVAAARALGRDAFGAFSLAWATGWLLATGSDLGLHLTAVREAVRGDEPFARVAGGAVAAKLVLTGAALAAVAVMAALAGGADRAAFALVALALVVLSYADLAQHLLRAKGEFGRDALVQTAARATLVAGGLAGLAAGGFTGLGVGMLAGAAAGAAVGAVAVRRAYGGIRLGAEARASAARLLAASLPLGLGVALSVLYFRLDLFLLDAFAGTGAVGLYAGAYRVFEAALLLPAVTLTVLFPRLAATAHDSPEGIAVRRRALAGLAAVGLVVAVAGSVAARPLLTLLYGAEFAPAATPLAVLWWAAPLVYVNYLLTQDLISRRRQTRYAALAAVALAFNLAANLAAIPRFGAAGAAAVTGATEAVILAGCAASLWGRWRPSSVAAALAAAALFSLPFETERLALRASGFVVTVPEALVVATVVVAAVAAARSRSGVLADRALAIAAAAFVAVLLASALLAPDHAGNAVKFTMRMAAGAAFGLAVCWLVAERPRRAAVVVGAYAAGVAVAACLGLAEMVSPEWADRALALFREAPIYAAGLRRLSSTYGYPNTAATSIAMALPAVVAACAASRSAARAAAVATAGVMAVALVATFSRGGLVASLVALGALAWAARGPAARAAAAAALAVVAVWAAAGYARVGLANRGLFGDESSLLVAHIEAAASSLDVDPAARGRMQVRVTNAGVLAWHSTPETPFVVVGRWYDAAGVALGGEGARAALPETVEPGQSVVVDGAFVAPSTPGDYVLAWDVYKEHRLRFSERGVPPARVAVRVSGAPPPPAPAEGAGPAPPAPPPEEPYVPPPRRDLWRAAWAMFRERPIFGFGPDSYRLTYGRFLGLEKWDHRVYANNLALELLATTGTLGVAAFLALAAVVVRRARGARDAARAGRLDPLAAAAGAAALAAFVAFFAHGAVDYMLEFTAGYAPFWAMAGVLAGLARAGEGAAG